MTRDMDQVKCVKDVEGKILVQEKNTKDRWNTYFYSLFKEGYDITLDSRRLDIREVYQNYNCYRQIQK